MSFVREITCYLLEWDDGTYIATQALASDGVQDSDEQTTATLGVDIVVFQTTINPQEFLAGNLKGVYFYLEALFKAASSGTADLIWKWQVCDVDGNWIDLHLAVTETNIGTAYVNRIREGFFHATTGMMKLPIQVRLFLQCNEDNEGKGKVRNSSRVTIKVIR